MAAVPADNCPACVTQERSVTACPVLIQPDGGEGVRASYRCPECGHCWWTSWLLGVERTERVLRQAGAA